jgi:hypothetical protein
MQERDRSIEFRLGLPGAADGEVHGAQGVTVVLPALRVGGDGSAGHDRQQSSPKTHEKQTARVRREPSRKTTDDQVRVHA